MLEYAIQIISSHLDTFSGVNAIEVVDVDNVNLRYQCPKTDEEKIKNFQTVEDIRVDYQVLEFLESNFLAKQ